MPDSHPKIRRLGYARVSTYGQTRDAQLEQLKAEGCAKIYREKARLRELAQSYNVGCATISRSLG
jgi:DNA invertase Pin-like site-specific DNA recombinase